MADTTRTLSAAPTASGSGSGSGSQFQLPDRKTFIATLSGTAFVLGLTGGSIYALRRARAQALREASASAAGVGVGARGAYTATPALEAGQSPLQLFASMNAAILHPGASASARASPAATSVFDEPQNTGLPSVLQRRRTVPVPAPRPSTSASASASGSKIDESEMDSTLDFLALSTPQDKQPLEAGESEYRPRGFFDTPVGLSLKAFVLATALVGSAAAAAVELTRRAMGVHNMDQFVLRMAQLVPSRAAASNAVPPTLRSSSSSSSSDSDALPARPSHPPLSTQEALDQLASADSLDAFLRTLKTQLDAERDAELARRFPPSPSRHNDVLAPSYAIHSPHEPPRSTLNPLGISPLLPTLAFGLGFLSGLSTAGKKAGLVFMAENAHRLPDTVQGWYFYSKTKNYRIMLAALKGGARTGTKTALWTGAFCVAERTAQLTREYLVPSVPIGHWADGTAAGALTALGAVSLC